VQARKLMDSSQGANAIIITVNAGRIPQGHWAADSDIGGGRIAGEGCHFIDLARYFAGSPIADWTISSVRPLEAAGDIAATINLRFLDHSAATIHYLSTGHRSFPKERVEVFRGGNVIQIDNFRTLRVYGRSGADFKTWARNLKASQDKGHRGLVEAFLKSLDGGPEAIPVDELLEVGTAACRLQSELSGDA